MLAGLSKKRGSAEPQTQGLQGFCQGGPLGTPEAVLAQGLSSAAQLQSHFHFHFQSCEQEVL